MQAGSKTFVFDDVCKVSAQAVVASPTKDIISFDSFLSLSSYVWLQDSPLFPPTIRNCRTNVPFMTKTNSGLKDWMMAGSALVVVLLLIWCLVHPAFARIPGLETPGTIFVSAEQGPSHDRLRVDVQVQVDVSQTQTSLSISLHGDPNSPVSLDEAGDLILGFCGGIRDIQLVNIATGDAIALKSLNVNDPQVWSSQLGHLSDCRMAKISKYELTGTWLGDSGRSWALPRLMGTTSAVTKASAGAQHRYVFPNVVTTHIPIGEVPFGTVASKSMVELTTRGISDEYIPAVSSPALDDPGALKWNFPMSSYQGSSGHRLTGVDQAEATVIQAKLFFAAALSGIAGTLLAWILGSIYRKSTSPQPVPKDVGAAEESSPLTTRVDDLSSQKHKNQLTQRASRKPGIRWIGQRPSPRQQTQPKNKKAVTSAKPSTMHKIRRHIRKWID